MTNLIKKPQTHFALPTIASHGQNSISTKRKATLKSKPQKGCRVNNQCRVPLIKGAFFLCLSLRAVENYITFATTPQEIHQLSKTSHLPTYD